MLLSLSIENFGPVRERQTLSLEADKSTHLEDHFVLNGPNGERILKLALIYGPNASGKTTILTALEFLRTLVDEPVSEKSDKLKFSPFAFDEHSKGLNSKIEIVFVHAGVKYRYEVEFNRSAIMKERLHYHKPNKALVFERTTDPEKQLTHIELGSKFSLDKAQKAVLEANTIWNNVVLAGFQRTNIEFEELNQVLTWFQHYLKELVLPKSSLNQFVSRLILAGFLDKDLVVQILNKADYNISDLVVTEEEEEIPEMVREILEKTGQKGDVSLGEFLRAGKVSKISEFLVHEYNERKYALAIASESHGTQRYYGLAGLLAMLTTQYTMFCIDELESSLHPDLFKHFLVTFLTNKSPSQLIATTHHREFLDNRDLFRPDTIWFTEKNRKGAVDLFSLADFGTTTIRKEKNVLSAYRAGKLGAVPNIGDPYLAI